MKPPILCIGPFIDAIIHPLQERYELHRIYADTKIVPGLKEWEPIRAVVTGGVVGAKREIIEALPSLELIAINGVGTDAVDLDLCKARGIAVKTLTDGLMTAGATTAVDGSRSDMLTDDVADMAMGLLVSAARGVSFGDRFVRTGKWGKDAFPPGTRVTGKRIGIYGLGRIGKAVARRASGFDMEIGYANRRPVEGAPWRRFDDIRALAEWADFLVLCAPANPDSIGVVNADVLALLGPTGILVNIARGALVDEDALVAALKSGGIRAAGLDVFRNEPKVPEALLEMPNVALTPHQGSSKETKEKMSEILVAIVNDHYAQAAAA